MYMPTKHSDTQPLVNRKTTALGRQWKISESNAIAYGFIHFLYKYVPDSSFILSDLLFG